MRRVKPSQPSNPVSINIKVEHNDACKEKGESAPYSVHSVHAELSSQKALHASGRSSALRPFNVDEEPDSSVQVLQSYAEKATVATRKDTETEKYTTIASAAAPATKKKKKNGRSSAMRKKSPKRRASPKRSARRVAVS